MTLVAIDKGDEGLNFPLRDRCLDRVDEVLFPRMPDRSMDGRILRTHCNMDRFRNVAREERG